MRARESDGSVAPGRAWRSVATDDGSLTLVHPAHGETCHSTAGAWTQARERYARECRLRERASEIQELAARGERAAEFFLLDVGTGLGLNLAAACEALDGSGVVLRAVSLERDVEVLHATLRAFEESERAGAPRTAESSTKEVEGASRQRALAHWHAPIRAAFAGALEACREGRRQSRHRVHGGTVDLVLGDALETLDSVAAALRFDAIFLDPFSPRVERDSWDPAFLGRVAARLAPFGRLSTYTVSMNVRAALAAAGLRVGPGARVGRKSSGTVASAGGDVGCFDARTSRRLRRRAGARAAGPLGGRPGNSGCERASRGTDELE